MEIERVLKLDRVIELFDHHGFTMEKDEFYEYAEDFIWSGQAYSLKEVIDLCNEADTANNSYIGNVVQLYKVCKDFNIFVNIPDHLGDEDVDLFQVLYGLWIYGEKVFCPCCFGGGNIALRNVFKNWFMKEAEGIDFDISEYMAGYFSIYGFQVYLPNNGEVDEIPIEGIININMADETSEEHLLKVFNSNEYKVSGSINGEKFYISIEEVVEIFKKYGLNTEQFKADHEPKSDGISKKVVVTLDGEEYQIGVNEAMKMFKDHGLDIEKFKSKHKSENTLKKVSGI
jgi:hypothetical protein